MIKNATFNQNPCARTLKTQKSLKKNITFYVCFIFFASFTKTTLGNPEEALFEAAHRNQLVEESKKPSRQALIGGNTKDCVILCLNRSFLVCYFSYVLMFQMCLCLFLVVLIALISYYCVRWFFDVFVVLLTSVILLFLIFIV